MKPLTIGDMIADLGMLPVNQKRAVIKGLFLSLPDTDQAEITEELTRRPITREEVLQTPAAQQPTPRQYLAAPRCFHEPIRPPSLIEQLRFASANGIWISRWLLYIVIAAAVLGLIGRIAF